MKIDDDLMIHLLETIASDCEFMKDECVDQGLYTDMRGILTNIKAYIALIDKQLTGIDK